MGKWEGVALVMSLIVVVVLLWALWPVGEALDHWHDDDDWLG